MTLEPIVGVLLKGVAFITVGPLIQPISTSLAVKRSAARRTSLRGWRRQLRGGSNPPFRTN